MSEQPPNFPPSERPTTQQPTFGQQPEYGQQPEFGQQPPAGPPPFGADLDGPFGTPPPKRASFARRNRTPLIVAAAVVVLGGAGAGIAVAATSDSTTTASPGSSSSSVPGQGQPTSGSNAPGKGNKKGQGKGQGKNGAKQHPTRATIVSEATTSWTVRTKAGASMTVTINSDTKFGTMKAPATRTQFTVGKQVAIIGPKTGTAITAKRIRFPQQKASGATPSPATPSGTPS